MAHLIKKCTPAMDASVNTIGGGGTVGGAASLSTLTPEMHTVLHTVMIIQRPRIIVREAGFEQGTLPQSYQ